MTNVFSDDDDLVEDEEDEDEEIVRTVTVNQRTGVMRNLVYRLLGRKSVTRSWTRQPNPQLEFNFDKLTFCGVGFGQSVNALSLVGLGPAYETSGEGYRFLYYYDVGIEIWTSDADGIHAFLLYWWEFDSSFKPFPGKCQFRGREFSLTKDTSRKAVLDYFGKPSDVTQEEDFSCVDYKVGGGEFSIIFDDDRTISFIQCAPD